MFCRRFRHVMLFVCMLAAAVTTASTAHAKPNPEEVKVCLEFATSTNFVVIARSQWVAAQLFEDIGVRLRWTCDTSEDDDGPDDGISDPIIVRLSGNTSPDSHPRAWAFALPYAQSGPRIIVFYDRLRPVVEQRPISAGSIIGHVLAHEIGHVLEGVARHTPKGLMREHWSEQDFSEMGRTGVHFSQENSVLIHQAIHNVRVSAAR